MKRVEEKLDTKQVLSVVERYSQALDLLDAYDHQNMTRPKGSKAVYFLTYEECREIINAMKYMDRSSLFGNEKDESFKGSIGAVYQSFDGEDIYPTLEEKAANLLYFVTKNHSFSDGNKRIAATRFLYFLDKNGVLFRNGASKIEKRTNKSLETADKRRRRRFPAAKAAYYSFLAGMAFLAYTQPVYAATDVWTKAIWNYIGIKCKVTVLNVALPYQWFVAFFNQFYNIVCRELRY